MHCTRRGLCTSMLLQPPAPPHCGVTEVAWAPLTAFLFHWKPTFFAVKKFPEPKKFRGTFSFVKAPAVVSCCKHIFSLTF